jgi:hypothetical protein
VLMRPVDRRVHAHVPRQPACSIRLAKQLGVDPIPGAVLAEPAVPFPRGLPRAELRRQITPRRTRPISPNNRLDNATVIPERATALRRRNRHQRLNPAPRSIRQHLSSRHDISLPHPPQSGKETRPSGYAHIDTDHWWKMDVPGMKGLQVFVGFGSSVVVGPMVDDLVADLYTVAPDGVVTVLSEGTFNHGFDVTDKAVAILLGGTEDVGGYALRVVGPDLATVAELPCPDGSPISWQKSSARFVCGTDMNYDFDLSTASWVQE